MRNVCTTYAYDLRETTVLLSGAVQPRSDLAEHDQCVDPPVAGVSEGPWQAAYDGEAGGFPGGDGAGVGRYDEVELHGAEPAGAGGIQRMGEQRSGDAFALRRGSRGVAGVGDMRPAAALVRTEVGGAENGTFGFGHEDLSSLTCEPIIEGGVSAAVGRHAEGLAGGADGCEDRPDRVVVSGFGRADQHGQSSPAARS